MTHPFHWVPAEGQRHASKDPLPECTFAYPGGTVITTLCGRKIPATTGTLAWLWFTCAECNDIAHDIVGRPRRNMSQRDGKPEQDKTRHDKTKRSAKERPKPETAPPRHT